VLATLLQHAPHVDALRCNGEEDDENCGTENLPETFCDATTFSDSLNEKLAEYTQLACPVMCRTCITTTSTTTMVMDSVEPTEPVKITPKQSIAIFGLIILPFIIVGLAYTFRQERIPVSVMSKVKSTNIDAAVNRRLHAGVATGLKLAPHQATAAEAPGSAVPSPPQAGRTRQSVASVSSVESGLDDTDAAFPAHPDDYGVPPPRASIDRPSFNFTKPAARLTNPNPSPGMQRRSGPPGMHKPSGVGHHAPPASKARLTMPFSPMKPEITAPHRPSQAQ
jgi:hypothetical protein